jgi:flagellar basal body L-ring protein FlgH
MSGCLQMYLKKRRSEHVLPPPPPPPSPRAKATGSLWRDDVSANYLFADTEARFPGDLLTIVITEDSRVEGSRHVDRRPRPRSSRASSSSSGCRSRSRSTNPTSTRRQLVKASSSASGTARARPTARASSPRA